MSAPYTLGENCHLYYSATPVTSTTFTIPTTEATHIKDVKVSGKQDTPEYTTRANGGVKQYAVSLKDFGITFLIQRQDTLFSVWETAWSTGVEVAAFALDDLKTVTGARGPGGNWVVSDMSRSEGNSEVVFYTVDLKPSTFNAWYIGT
jgi:hypothetical protein